MKKKKPVNNPTPAEGVRVVFMNGDKRITMKISEMYEDGSVRLIDGDRLRVDEIIEYLK